MKYRVGRWQILLLVLVLTTVLSGCAKYQARSAFDEAEELIKAEQYDQAVEKYFAATQDDPGNRTYKIKLLSARTRAAADHINKARVLARDGQIEDAIAQYRLARGFDPSVEVAALEAKQLEGLLRARTLADEGLASYRARNYVEARKLLRQALEHDPHNARALELQKLLATRPQPVIMDGVELDISSSEPITLRFKQADLREVFGILGELTGINFIVDEELKDKTLTVLLEKATFSQSMELILQMTGLGKKVLNGKTIIVFPQTKDKAKQYEDQLIQTFYLAHIDAKKAVNLLRTMLQLRKVYVHEERNALVIRDTPETIKLAEQVLKAADRANAEVLFDLEVVAVGNTDALEFGPRLNSTSVKVGFGTLTTGTDTPLTLIPDNTITDSLSNLHTFYTVPSATFDLAKTLTDTEILASPKIRVRNNEKAKVHIGTREPVITVTTTGETSTDNIQYVDVGVKLDVEPNIQLDQAVQTKLTLEVSQVIDRFETKNGSVALTIRTTNAQSVLTLKDGVQTIIGGLFESDKKNTKQTIPFIGEIPLLGDLISNFNNSDTKREILLSITPYIVKQIEVPDADVATLWSGGEEDLLTRPKFGAFSQPLLSEVDATSLSAAPALSRSSAPAPFSAVHGKAYPVPGSNEPPAAAPPSSGADVVTPSPAAVPVEPPTVLSPSGAVEPSAQSLLTLPKPVAGTEIPPGATAVPLPVPVPSPAAEPAPAPAGESAPAPAAESVLPPPAAAPAATENKPAGLPMVLPPLPKPTPRLSFSGETVAKTGAEVVLAVQVADVERLYSAPLFVSFDPALLELVTVEEGTFLAQGGQSTVFSHSLTATPGQVVIGYKQGVGGSGASGNGLLFTLKLRGKTAGTTRVELGRINFRDPAGTRLAVDPVAASVTIQ